MTSYLTRSIACAVRPASFGLLLLVLFSESARGEWRTPENPAPSEILKEARKDTQAKRYEDALAKHVWFHHNALRYKPSLYGVRLSYALGDWRYLSTRCAPALTKLHETRSDAESKVKQGVNARAFFHDFQLDQRRPRGTREDQRPVPVAGHPQAADRPERLRCGTAVSGQDGRIPIVRQVHRWKIPLRVYSRYVPGNQVDLGIARPWKRNDGLCGTIFFQSDCHLDRAPRIKQTYTGSRTGSRGCKKGVGRAVISQAARSRIRRQGAETLA